jgi:cell wall-associated NlpC family hydrolase
MSQDKTAAVLEHARKHLRQPWRDSGPGPFCASFVRRVFLEAGIKLPVAATPSDYALTRRLPQGPSYANSLAGDEIGGRITSQKDLLAGDLVFWSGTDPKYPPGVITHVGIYVGDGKVIDRGDSKVEERPMSTFRQFVEARRPTFMRAGKTDADVASERAGTALSATSAAAIRTEAERQSVKKENIDTALIVIAKAQAYVPKVWRAPHAGPYCASFVRQVFADAGIRLGIAAKPTDAQLTRGLPQGETYANSLAGDDIGQRIASKSNIAPGDIVFWELTDKKFGRGVISHVGIYAGEGMIIDRGEQNVQRRPLDTFKHFVEARRVRM